MQVEVLQEQIPLLETVSSSAMALSHKSSLFWIYMNNILLAVSVFWGAGG